MTGWILLACALGADPHADNKLFATLLQEGVRVSDGSTVPLPAPCMPDGLDAAAQRAAMERLPGLTVSLDDFLRPAIVAPHALRIEERQAAAEKSPVRGVDIGFVARAPWQLLRTKELIESLLSLGGQGRSAAGGARVGFLAADALAKRGLADSPQARADGGWHFSRATFLDRVQLEATRQIVFTRGAESLIIAARIDPRFDRDAEFPNQWRSIDREPGDPAQTSLGAAHPYSASAFFAKITQLQAPAGALFVEYHVVFEEPQGWFEGRNMLRSKLPLAVREEVRSFRGRLLKLQP